MFLNQHTPSSPAERALRVAETNPVVAAILHKRGAAMLAVSAQLEALDAAAAAVADPHTTRTGRSAVADALAAGRPLPDLLEVFKDDLHLEALHTMAARELGSLREELVLARDREASGIVAGLFDDLHEALVDVVGRARPVWESLAGVTTAAAAVDAGRTDEWKAWTVLDLEHEHVRGGQHWVASVAFGDQLGEVLSSRVWPFVALVSNAEDIVGTDLRCFARPAVPTLPFEGLAGLMTHPAASPWVPSPDAALARADALAAARTALTIPAGTPSTPADNAQTTH